MAPRGAAASRLPRQARRSKVSLADDTKAVIKSDRVQPHHVEPADAKSLWQWLNKEADAHEVKQESRLVIATTILFTLNSPAGLAGVYRAATEGLDTGKQDDLKKATRVALVMRETGLKCAALNGLPSTINCLAGLRAAFDKQVTEALPKDPRRALSNEAAPAEAVAKRGRELFANIYDPQTEKLVGVLQQNHPDMANFILDFEYGGLLAPPSPDYPVQREDTSILAVSCLRSQGGVAPQVMSHVLGLRKAQAVEGATWMTSEEGCQWLLKTVDSFVDRARGGAPVKAKL